MSRVSVNSEADATNNKKNHQLFDSKTRLKKKKRRKDLEQLRRNVLAAKQNFRRRSLQASRINCNNNKLSKNSLKKALNMFAEVRQDNENKTQGLTEEMRNKKSNGKRICARLLPDRVIGIFKNGAKGKAVRRRTATNRLLHGTNEAQIHTDVFKLLNGDEESSSSNKTADNSENNSDNLNEDEKTDDSRGIPSIPHHHHLQPSNVIKGNLTFNTASNSKWMSNYTRMENGGKERQLTSTNVTENAQSDDKYKRRLTDCTHDSDNYHTLTPSEIDALHFPIRSRKKDDRPMYQEELLKNAAGNKVQSIKRWGISPVYCYDELCAKINEENFSFSFAQYDDSDPIKEIKDTLAALYVESHEQQTDSSINDKVSFTSSTPAIHQNQIGSTEFNSSHSSFMKSSLPLYQSAECHGKFNNTLHKHHSWNISEIPSQNNENQMNFLQYTNMSPINGRHLMNFETKIPNEINKYLGNHERKKEMPQEYIERQVDKPLNLDCILEPSVPVDWNAIAEKQESSVRRKPKYMPTILRRSNADPGISVDIKSNGFSKSNVTKNVQGVRKQSKKSIKFQHHTLNENTNSLLMPSTISHITCNNKKDKAHENNDMMHSYNFSIPNNEFMTYNNVKISEKIPAYIEPKNINNYQQHSRSSSCDFQPRNIAERLPQINYEDIFQRYHYRDSMNVQAHSHLPNSNHISPQLHEMSVYSSDCISNRNSDSLANEYYINPNKQEISRVASLDQLWNAHGQHWRTSNFGHNMNNNTTFLPTNTHEIVHHRENNYLNPNVEMNSNAVLHYLRGLSFEEDKINRCQSLTNHSRCCIGNERQTPEIYSNSQQPTKYYAVSKKNDDDNQLPQRIPIYLSNEKPQFINKIKNEKPQQRVTVLEQPETCIAASHKLNFVNDVRIASVNAKMQNNSCSIPMKFNRDFSENYCDNVQGPIETIVAMANANIPIDKSLNSQNASCAREILLENGRIGLFVPRNNRQNNQLKRHCVNNYNSENKSLQADNSTYQHRHHHHHHKDYYRH